MKLVMLAAAVLLSWAPPVAAQGDTFDLKEWPVEWGGRTRDPAIAPDGKVWFVGQEGNYIANLDPGDRRAEALRDRSGHQPAHAHRRRGRHRVVRGQPQRPHRPARSGDRRDQDDHDRRGEGSAHAGVRRQGQHLVHVAGIESRRPPEHRDREGRPRSRRTTRRRTRTAS